MLRAVGLEGLGAYLGGAGLLWGPQQHSLSQGPVHSLLCQLLQLLLLLQETSPAVGHPSLQQERGELDDS